MKRIGLLGGAFNPPHLGHLALGRLAWERLALDELRFVPTALSPHKPTEGPGGAVRRRLLELALEGSPFRLDPIELDRGGRSYTVDTLQALRGREPSAAWILVLGADQAEGLPGWRDADRIWELAAVAVARRPGSTPFSPGPFAPRLRQAWSGLPGELVLLPSTGLEIASSALRENLRQGLNPPEIPAQVLAAIHSECLYR